jgi:hypothetical protein
VFDEPPVHVKVCIAWGFVQDSESVCCCPITPLLVESFLLRPKRISCPHELKELTDIDAAPPSCRRNVE